MIRQKNSSLCPTRTQAANAIWGISPQPCSLFACLLSGKLLENRCQRVIALLEIRNGSHDLLVGTFLTRALELLGKLAELTGVRSVVIHHVIHQSAELRHGRGGMLVVMTMLVRMTRLVQMVMGVGMLVIVLVGMLMLVGVSMSIVSMLVAVAMRMLMAVSAVGEVFVTHSDISFYLFVS